MSSPLPQPSDPIVQVTIEYPNSRVAQAQIAQQSAKGLQVKSMTTVNQNVGCLRFFLFGFWAFVFKPQPHIMVVFEGRQSEIKMAQQAKLDYDASVIKAKQEASAQAVLIAREKQANHMAKLNAPQAFLHTLYGAITIIGAFVLILIIQAVAKMDAPYLLPLLSVALAILDWQNFSTFHGAIPWSKWKAESKNWFYYGLGAILWLYGWIFMPLVYAGQVLMMLYSKPQQDKKEIRQAPSES